MPTRSLLGAKAALSLVLLVASLVAHVSAQQESSRSVDPLNGSTLPTNIFTPAQTFTPVTTFAQATGGQQTVLTGVGPSVDPGTALFTYTRPTASVAPTPNDALSASLASSGYPTATDARNLAPSPNNLQIADDAVRTGASLFALAASAAVGALLVFGL
ncbi:uncharacterized protein PFL1_00083 [Pseudozyma flocculosa PF-1]|uniref:Uncharacterized protein n=1 Tax=Pseudozyma flocculosa TaxID=84751 RepID=A0A5C3ESI5_9BASI|nr:uncharacterized protein PFL1_00083 [Pseudozyma flocculosa PF-1]EPQ31884.1 hypothetical protein PFL1_00083 [Pseudozyma flocculosa PF-1]SPO35208.1 uncharacterized protein PSFLO_00679 [Pseudozyma flocculosa]